jgi:3-(methylthio)propanoyl-CoA dehydrogenase
LIASANIVAGKGDTDFLRAKIATARFYAECLLPQAEALGESIIDGSDAVLALTADQF